MVHSVFKLSNREKRRGERLELKVAVNRVEQITMYIYLTVLRG